MNACAYPEVPNPWIVADTECENLWPGRFSMEASAVSRQVDSGCPASKWRIVEKHRNRRAAGIKPRLALQGLVPETMNAMKP